MGTGNDSILDAYLFETNSLLEQLDSLVLAAEQQDSFSEEDVNTIFRIMHTIKGSSAMMEFQSLAAIAHRAEDLFSLIRDRSIAVVPESLRPELFDLLFQTIDFFRGEVEHIEANQPLTDNIDSLLEKVNSFIAQIQGGPAAPDGQAPAAAGQGGSAPAGFPYALHVYFEEGCGMENLRAVMLVNSVTELCPEDSFAYQPADLQNDPNAAARIIDDGFLLRFRTPEDREHAVHAVTGAGFVKSYLSTDEAETPPEPAPEPEPQPAPEPEPEAQAPAPAPEPAPFQPAPPQPAPAAPQPSAPPAPQSSPTGQNAPHRESLISVNLRHHFSTGTD